MQRIMVDLPEPDGPQITMRSPRIDLEVDVAQHVEIAVPLVHADDLDRERRSRAARRAAASALTVLLIALPHRLSAGREPRFEHCA